MRRAALPLTVALAVLPGCGGKKAETPPIPRTPDVAALRAELQRATTVPPGTFPRGRTLRDVARAVPSSGPGLALATPRVSRGEHRRLAFGLRGAAGPVRAPIALYLAPSETAEVIGPLVATADLPVTPLPRLLTAGAQDDPAAPLTLSSVLADVHRAGTYRLLAVARVDGALVGSTGTLRVTAAGDGLELGATAGYNGPTLVVPAADRLCRDPACRPALDLLTALERRTGARVRWERGGDELLAVDRRGRVAARYAGAFGITDVEDALRAAER